MDIRVVPLEWAGKRRSPIRSRFRASNNNMMALLRRELTNLGASNVVIQAGFTREQIRNDGWPRSSARTADPAVILNFQVPKRGKDGKMGTDSYAYPCDKYDQWEDNLYAIALTLERLRSVGRYGVVRGGEQYTGWRQLPPGGGENEPNAAMSVEDSARFLASLAGDLESWRTLMSDPEALSKVYGSLGKRYHPDMPTGDRQTFEAIAERVKTIREHRK